jgi:hypothetical protein
MTWSNFLKSIPQSLWSEALLLLLSLAWVLLRLLNIIVKKVEDGSPIRLKVFGKEFVEVVESSNSEVKLTGENI